MRDISKTVLILIVVICELSNGLEYNKQRRQNTNTDFLLHESGFPSLIPTSNAKKQQEPLSSTGITGPNQKPQSGVNTNYDSDFPSLKPTNNKSQSNNNNKSPEITTTTTPKNQAWNNGALLPATGKRDYVNRNYPKLSLSSTQPTTITNNHNMNINGVTSVNSPTSPKPSGKRDYVNPNYQNGPGSGKVKDLINFYDNKNQGQTGTTNPPTFSSIVQGNKNTASSPALGTTAKPTNTATNNIPGQTTANPTRPVLLPSSINNNNKNTQVNSNRPSDDELQTLSEELLRKDTNNAAKYITINYQEKTTSQSNEDKAPLPLLSVSPEVWNIPTVQKFIPLLDNYERDTLVNEYVTPQERNEENAFMDAIMSTGVIRHLMNFLKDKGYLTPDPKQQRDFLKQLWFTLYSRGKGKISSSGFEHVFVSELKNGDVMGLHNWIYFYKEEAARHANYLGYMKNLQFNDKGAVIKLHFSQEGINKPVNTMFLGTSPELEIALYTLCFVTRADNDCRLRLGSKYVDIVTHTFRYRSKNFIGSAYPQI